MELVAKAHPTSRYPSGHLKKIARTYQTHDATLQQVSQILPDAEDTLCESVEALENRILLIQEKLLELAATAQITTPEDVKDILELWHTVAIKHVAPQDISLADNLVLAVYTHMAQSAA